MKMMVLFSLMLTGLTAHAELICNSADSSYSVEYQLGQGSARGKILLARYEVSDLSCQEGLDRNVTFKGQKNTVLYSCIPNKLVNSSTDARALILKTKEGFSTVLIRKGKVLAELSCNER